MLVSESQNTIITIGFHALSDSLRVKIIQLLQSQELCVCDLCDRLNVNQSKLSFHLKTLKEANLVCPRQSGRWIYYSLNLPQFALLEQHLGNLCRNATISPRSDCD